MDEQSAIENIRLVRKIMEQLGLKGDEDLEQDTLLYLYKRRGNYNPSRNTKWSTYAWKVAETYLKTMNARKVEKERHYLDFTSFAENASDLAVAPQENSIAPMFNHLMKNCTEHEKQIIRLRLQGYKLYEIGAMQGQSRKDISNQLKIIREKVLKNS